MGIINQIFRKNYQNSIKSSMDTQSQMINVPIINENIAENLNSSEIVQITENGILDTSSLENIYKFKNNLKILIKKAKENGKIDKFMIIRDDDFFPYDWKWRVSSYNTAIEKVMLPISYELKKQYALKQLGVVSNINGINIPIPQNKVQDAISNVDKDMGKVSLPVAYRSTKHFTINTPLEATFNYNIVKANRNFTIMDNIDSFLESGYGYSISYHDAYLDVSHEDLKISKDAIVLIEKDKYQNIIKNSIIEEQLKERKVIVYTGDEYLAINMVLSELGILPSQVGYMYAEYDDEINKILEDSIKNLASNNNLLYDKSHGGKDGHFTDYYDSKNNDVNNSISNFVQFLRLSFPECSNLITDNNIKDSNYCCRIVQAIGIERLLLAIKQYNYNMENQFNVRFENYKTERESVSNDISNIFKLTLKCIREYYENIENSIYDLDVQRQIEDDIFHFFQENKIQDQLIYAKKIWNTFGNNVNHEKDYSDSSENKFKR